MSYSVFSNVTCELACKNYKAYKDKLYESLWNELKDLKVSKVTYNWFGKDVETELKFSLKVHEKDRYKFIDDLINHSWYGPVTEYKEVALVGTLKSTYLRDLVGVNDGIRLDFICDRLNRFDEGITIVKDNENAYKRLHELIYSFGDCYLDHKDARFVNTWTNVNRGL